MNPYVVEMLDVMTGADVGPYLEHYGTKRHSGRYPWGSGENPYQGEDDLYSRMTKFTKDNPDMSELEIAKAFGYSSTTNYRTAYTNAKNEHRIAMYDMAKDYIDQGKSVSEVGRLMGMNESSVRSLLNEKAYENSTRAVKMSHFLKDQVDKKGYIDVGKGVERELNMSPNKLKDTLALLKDEGYNVVNITVPQLSDPKKRTTISVLCKPGDAKEQQRELYQDPSKVQSLVDYTPNDPAKVKKFQYPASISSDRVAIRYGDQGGESKDGVMEIRRGVQDLSLGDSHYAQVRIMVDGDRYLKGMAIYSDNLPDGVDIMFNTNKKSGTPKRDVMKEAKPGDPLNPFGAYISPEGQSYYTGKDGKQHLSAINKLKQEGDWEKQSRTISSQFLSKQPMELIKSQLNLTLADYKEQYDEINSLTNPTIKKKMLADFADTCDSAVVHMKAAAFPRQQTRVILPVDSLKDNEIYAPYLRNGEKVCLVRYPHGGTFEIPYLTVNNKNAEAKKELGVPLDAVGINSKVASQLSGADFDGDTVVVIPTNSKVKIAHREPLEQLKGFNPSAAYSGYEGMKVISKTYQQKQMGVVSNLITDMTLGGASDDEIAHAVKHSMVVIDAYKHKLDWKQSYKDNGIEELKDKWQAHVDDNGNIHYGASTLISRHKQTVAVPERRGSARITPEGNLEYKTSGRTFVDKKTGKVRQATIDVPLLSTVDDLNELVRGTPQEKAYAAYGNQLKALAQQARKEYLATPGIAYNRDAAKKYSAEVQSLKEKVDEAAKEAPKMRRAQAIANSKVASAIKADPTLSDKDSKKRLNKLKSQEMDTARAIVGVNKDRARFSITDREWEAIQAGAVSDTFMRQYVLRYVDNDALKERALPKTTTEFSKAKEAKIKAMRDSGYTIADIADSLGVSSSTITRWLSENR